MGDWSLRDVLKEDKVLYIASNNLKAARDFERTRGTYRSVHYLAFVIRMLHNFVKVIAHVF
jgi:hypothetical protein